MISYISKSSCYIKTYKNYIIVNIKNVGKIEKTVFFKFGYIKNYIFNQRYINWKDVSLREYYINTI